VENETLTPVSVVGWLGVTDAIELRVISARKRKEQEEGTVSVRLYVIIIVLDYHMSKCLKKQKSGLGRATRDNVSK